MDLVKALNSQYMKEELPEVKVGDTVRVHVRIKEGARERIQVFEGTVIARKHGGIGETVLRRGLREGFPPAFSQRCHDRDRPQGQGPSGKAVLPARPRRQGCQGQGEGLSCNSIKKEGFALFFYYNAGISLLPVRRRGNIYILV